MNICEIKAKKSFAGPGMWAWLAEARVEDENVNERYVTVHYYDGETYTVSEQSVYDHFDDDDVRRLAVGDTILAGGTLHTIKAIDKLNLAIQGIAAFLESAS